MHLRIEHTHVFSPTHQHWRTLMLKLRSLTFITKELFRTGSQFRITLHAHPIDVSDILGYYTLRYIRDFLGTYFVNKSPLCCWVKWHHESAELMNDATKRPNVCSLIILFTFDNLRCRITKCANITICYWFACHLACDLQQIKLKMLFVTPKSPIFMSKFFPLRKMLLGLTSRCTIFLSWI